MKDIWKDHDDVRIGASQLGSGQVRDAGRRQQLYLRKSQFEFGAQTLMSIIVISCVVNSSCFINKRYNRCEGPIGTEEKMLLCFARHEYSSPKGTKAIRITAYASR